MPSSVPCSSVFLFRAILLVVYRFLFFWIWRVIGFYSELDGGDSMKWVRSLTYLDRMCLSLECRKASLNEVQFPSTDLKSGEAIKKVLSVLVQVGLQLVMIFAVEIRFPTNLALNWVGKHPMESWSLTCAGDLMFEARPGRLVIIKSKVPSLRMGNVVPCRNLLSQQILGPPSRKARDHFCWSR